MTKQTWPRIKHVAFILTIASFWVWYSCHNTGIIENIIIGCGVLHLGIVAHAHWPTSKRVPSDRWVKSRYAEIVKSERAATAAIIAKYGSFGYDCCSDYGHSCDRNRK